MFDNTYLETYNIPESYHTRVKFKELINLEQQARERLNSKYFSKICEGLKLIPETAASFIVNNGVIEINADYDWKLLDQLIKDLIPWRIGPYKLGTKYIDSEWQSFYKWDVISSLIEKFKPKKIADLGCNNGYFMFRCLQYQPKLMIGFDPGERAYFQYKLIQHFIKRPELVYELLGLNGLEFFPNFFDCVLCLGVLYHRRDPLSTLTKINNCLNANGTLILETIVMEGEQPTALCIKGRYAQMKNVYFVPTVEAVRVWLSRAGFKDIELILTRRASIEEQRTTEYAPYKSLVNFLNEDKTRTIESLPYPYRAFFSAKKQD